MIKINYKYTENGPYSTTGTDDDGTGDTFVFDVIVDKHRKIFPFVIDEKDKKTFKFEKDILPLAVKKIEDYLNKYII